MIDCKFTLKELQLIRTGLKYLGNKHKDVALYILNEHIDKNGSFVVNPYSKADVIPELSRLVGIVDSLIRNKK